MKNKQTPSKRIIGSPNAIDVHVGQRMKIRRTLLGLSQEKVGEALGVTFQQIQKYERGTNRIGASRLYDLARMLDVSTDYFFGEMTEKVSQKSPGQVKGTAKEGERAPYHKDPMARRETLELVRAYYKIQDPAARRSLLKMVQSVAKIQS